jgi:L-threonylcarbamoyladenylate synthase
LDGGACQVGLESTIVSFASGEPEVLRLGGLALEEIEEVLGYKLNRVKTSSSNPTAPGMLLSHYNPGKKIIVGKIAELIIQNKGKRLGILSFSKEYKGDDIELNIILSSKSDVVEAAQNLFSALRKFSSSDVDCILTEFVPSVGIGKAINDRLTRAARY